MMSSEFQLVFLAITFALLYEKWEIFRYYVRFTIFLVLSMFFASVFIPIMLLKPKDYRNALYPAWGARLISKLLDLKWNMVGQENIIKDSGAVILINHQSYLDLLVLAEIWPVIERCTVISKKEIFYLWPFGLACWLWGTVFIDRARTKDAQDACNKVSKTINRDKAKICLFPEGTRHGGKTLLPFKKGAFHIAIAAQAPIQPIVVSRYKFLDHSTHKFDSAVNIISILPKIETKGLTKDDIESLIEKTYTIMSKEYINKSRV